MVTAEEYLDRYYPKNGVCLINDSIGWIGVISNKGKN
ncbi:MAG: hypothetical protein GBAus27B_000359 [Mycoplasmataceae bacterium]|nr:MAG: hypothetical protein GBAus27B_000359 [Mycoplasmataceae bacterium]